MTLVELAEKYGTDKGESKHGYTKHYDRMFGPIPRVVPVSLLEMGAWHGDSLRMWEEYFPKGHIVGTDVDPTAIRYLGPRITTEYANQADPVEMMRVCKQHGPFDIIIDDAGHIGLCQLKAFFMLFSMWLVNGGIYVIEDVTVNEDRSTLDYFKSGKCPIEYLDVASIKIINGNTPKSGLVVIQKTVAPNFMLVKADDPTNNPVKTDILKIEAMRRGYTVEPKIMPIVATS